MFGKKQRPLCALPVIPYTGTGMVQEEKGAAATQYGDRSMCQKERSGCVGSSECVERSGCVKRKVVGVSKGVGVSK